MSLDVRCTPPPDVVPGLFIEGRHVTELGVLRASISFEVVETRPAPSCGSARSVSQLDGMPHGVEVTVRRIDLQSSGDRRKGSCEDLARPGDGDDLKRDRTVGGA